MRRCLICGESHAACGAYRLKHRPVGLEGEFTVAEVEEMSIVTVPSRRVRDEEYFTSDRRLYLNGEGKVVEADDPSRKTLLVGKNGQIPIARARELALVAKDDESGTPAEPSTPETRGDAQPEAEEGAAEASTPASRKATKKAASKKK